MVGSKNAKMYETNHSSGVSMMNFEKKTDGG